MLTKTEALFRQRVLACAGFYKGALDGIWGSKTDAADQAFHAEYLRLQTIGGTFDARTEAVIISLLPKAQAKAREFMRVAGPTCKLLSGTRTYAEQDALYARGRSIKTERDAKGREQKVSVVTNARAGQSKHN
jgi:peptidoglycan L-alanyl-D-glutamate endopeptidase CwlK